MKTTMEMNLNLGHIKEELVSVPCEVELDIHAGTDVRTDPDTVTVASVKALEDGRSISVDRRIEIRVIKQWQKLTGRIQ